MLCYRRVSEIGVNFHPVIVEFGRKWPNCDRRLALSRRSMAVPSPPMPDGATPNNMIGARVREVRLALGWTQEKLAIQCQLVGFDASRATLAQIESGYHKVSDIEYAVVAAALRVKLDHLTSDQLPTWRPRRAGG